jgi:hypothetical protein
VSCTVGLHSEHRSVFRCFVSVLALSLVVFGLLLLIVHRELCVLCNMCAACVKSLFLVRCSHDSHCRVLMHRLGDSRALFEAFDLN